VRPPSPSRSPRPAIGRLILPIHLADPDTCDAWMDELVLHHRKSSWAIADILFMRDKHNRLCGKGTLRRVLHECIRQPRKTSPS
jgi:hypothetical protein